MRVRWVRLLVGTVGLAAVVYGAASITGGWLGEPPWWEKWTPSSLPVGVADHLWTSRATRRWPDRIEVLAPRDGRETVSILLAVVGVALIGAVAVPSLNAGPRRVGLRVALALVGLTAVMYGAASLTGAWLGDPPWWWRDPLVWPIADPLDPPKGFPPIWTQQDAMQAGDAGLLLLSPRSWEILRPNKYRELISAAVILAGLGLLAGAAWRRRKGALSPG